MATPIRLDERIRVGYNALSFRRAVSGLWYPSGGNKLPVAESAGAEDVTVSDSVTETIAIHYEGSNAGTPVRVSRAAVTLSGNVTKTVVLPLSGTSQSLVSLLTGYPVVLAVADVAGSTGFASTRDPTDPTRTEPPQFTTIKAWGGGGVDSRFGEAYLRFPNGPVMTTSDLADQGVDVTSGRYRLVDMRIANSYGVVSPGRVDIDGTTQSDTLLDVNSDGTKPATPTFRTFANLQANLGIRTRLQVPLSESVSDTFFNMLVTGAVTTANIETGDNVLQFRSVLEVSGEINDVIDAGLDDAPRRNLRPSSVGIFEIPAGSGNRFNMSYYERLSASRARVEFEGV